MHGGIEGFSLKFSTARPNLFKELRDMTQRLRENSRPAVPARTNRAARRLPLPAGKGIGPDSDYRESKDALRPSDTLIG